MFPYLKAIVRPLKAETCSLFYIKYSFSDILHKTEVIQTHQDVFFSRIVSILFIF
jgi:hypothetical protein